MRIRSTKPEFWRSERVASVPWDARLVLKGLESYVDDNGVGKDDLALIVADVFPRDLSRNPPGTLQKVSEALDRLSDAGLLWRYEANGTSLVYIAFWETVQRIEKPTKGRFPRPDGTMDYRDSIIRESSGNPPGILPEPSGQEQGNRGTGEQVEPPQPPKGGTTEKPRRRTTSHDYDSDPDFAKFWDVYPRKVAKPQAFKAWKAARKRGELAHVIIAAAERYRDNPNRKPDYTAHPATWLNAERYNDYDEVTSPPSTGWWDN